MIGVNEAFAYYEDQLECLRLVKRAGGGLASPRFASLTPQQLRDRLEEIRNELDRQVVLLLVASAEGYFPDKSGLTSPDPRTVHQVDVAMFQDLAMQRTDFPRPY